MDDEWLEALDLLTDPTIAIEVGHFSISFVDYDILPFGKPVRLYTPKGERVY